MTAILLSALRFVTIDDPIACIKESAALNSITLLNLRHQPGLDLMDRLQIDLPGRIIAVGPWPDRLPTENLGVTTRSSSVFGALVIDHEKKESSIYTIVLRHPYSAGSFERKENWII